MMIESCGDKKFKASDLEVSFISFNMMLVISRTYLKFLLPI